MGLLTNIGKRVDALTKGGKKSLAEVAKEIGLAQSVLWKAANNRGEPSAKTLIAIAKYFNCSIDDLLSDPDSAEQYKSQAEFEVKLLRELRKLDRKEQEGVLFYIGARCAALEAEAIRRLPSSIRAVQ